MTVEVGKKAPDFSLEGSDGKIHSLSDYAGKKVVIYFYPKDNTPGCTKEACAFRDYNKELNDMGVIILGVSKDSLKSHDNFISKFNLPFPLLSDPDLQMMEVYDAWREKVLYGKKTIGCVRSTVILDENGMVIKHWKKVPKAADHPQKVFEWLKNN